jgi:hypothetical protein
MPSMPKRGPGRAFSNPAGSCTSTSSISGWSEQLPNNMFTSWLVSCPVVAGAMPSTTSPAPSAERIDSTVATISRRMRSSRIAATGISTLCSAASASARARNSASGAWMR